MMRSGYRVSGIAYIPGKEPTISVERAWSSKGIGRWIYCKYCYKNVLPMMSGINQIVCSECGYGLTPDFFTFKALKRWLKGDDPDEIYEEDFASDEAKQWKATHR